MYIFNSFYLLDSCCQSLKWSLLGVKNRLGQVQIELRRVSRAFHMEFPPSKKSPPLTQPHPHPLKYQENLFLSPLYSYVFTLQLPIHLCVKTSSFPGFSPTRCVKSAQTTFYSYLIGIQLHVSLHRSQDSF